VSGSGISWAICKPASRSRQITMPAPHHSVFLQAGRLSCRPTNSVKALKAHKHWSTLIYTISCSMSTKNLDSLMYCFSVDNYSRWHAEYIWKNYHIHSISKKINRVQQFPASLSTTGTGMPYRITQCYLSTSRGDIPISTPSQSWYWI